LSRRIFKGRAAALSPTSLLSKAARVDTSTLSNQLERGHHDVVSGTQAGIFASRLFGACQIITPLSVDGIRLSLLCFDFLSQLKHFVPNAAERYG
jgi:hypothetical protein